MARDVTVKPGASTQASKLALEPRRPVGKATNAQALAPAPGLGDRVSAFGSAIAQRATAFGHGVAEAAELLRDLAALTANDAEVDLGNIVRFVQRVGAFDMLQISDNKAVVHVRYDTTALTADITAPKLSLDGFTSPTFTAGASELDDVNIHLDLRRRAARLVTTRASMNAGTLTKGKDRIGIERIELSRLVLDGKRDGAMRTSFDKAQVYGLRYPGAPPIDTVVNDAGLSFESLDAVLGPSTDRPLAHAPAALPDGIRIQIELSGVTGGTTTTGAAAGFDHLHAALVQPGQPATAKAATDELAAVTIDGFHARAATGGSEDASGTIDRLEITGTQALVEQLLEAEQLRAQPAVRQAIDLVASSGAVPAAGGSIVLEHIGANVADNKIHAVANDVAIDVDVPNVGKLVGRVTGLEAEPAASKPAGSPEVTFDHLDVALRDPAGTEIARLDLAGTATSKAGVPQRKFVGTGDLARLTRVVEQAAPKLPPSVLSALHTVQDLHVSGELSGELGVETNADGAKLAGDFEAKLDLSGGQAQVSIRGIHGDIGRTAAVGFDRFEARFVTPHGAAVATVIIEGAGDTHTSTTNTFTARKVVVNGDVDAVDTLVAAIDKKAPNLIPVMNTVGKLLESYRIDGTGKLEVSNLKVDDGARGHVLHGDATGEIHVADVGTIKVHVVGLEETRGKAGQRGMRFARMDLELSTPAHGKAATIVAMPVRMEQGARSEFKAKRVEARGDAGDLRALLAATTRNIGLLPPQLRSAIEAVVDLDVEGSIAVSVNDVDVSSDAKATRVDGRTRFEIVGIGAIEVEVRKLAMGAASRKGGQAVDFDALEATLRDGGGRSAAHVLVNGTSGQLKGDASQLHAGKVRVEGDGKSVAALVTGIEQHVHGLPPAIAQAFVAAKPMLAGVTGSFGADGLDIAGSSAHAAVRSDQVTAATSIDFTDKQGGRYHSEQVTLRMYDANLELGADGKPRKVDAEQIQASGRFEGRQPDGTLSGTAALRAESAHVTIGPGGRPIHAEVAKLLAHGDVEAGTTAHAAAAPELDAKSIVRTAASIRSATIKAQTPVTPGRYGGSFGGITVAPNTTFNVYFVVHEHAISPDSYVRFVPELELPLWLGVSGAHFEAAGRRAALEVDLRGCFDINVAGALGDGGTVPLDLVELVRTVLARIQSGMKRNAPKSSGDDDIEMPRQPDHQPARRRRGDDPDVEHGDHDEISDVVTKGFQWGKTSGSADIELASNHAGGGIEYAHLRGKTLSSGGLLLEADRIKAQAGGATIATQNVSTGTVHVGGTSAKKRIEFDAFRIERLDIDTEGDAPRKPRGRP